MFNYRLMGDGPAAPNTEADQALVETVRDYLCGENLSSQTMLAQLKTIPSIDFFYDLLSGVGERYTVGQQTQMALDIFEQEFANIEQEYNRSSFDYHLYECQGYGRCDKNAFWLLLALCNLGKGLNFFEGNGKNKAKELATTRGLVEQYSPWIPFYKHKMEMINAFLEHDIIGDYLKGRASEEKLDIANRKILQVAKTLELKPHQIFDKLVVLHQIMASRYPIVRQHCFITEADQTISAGGVELPKLRRDNSLEDKSEFIASAYCLEYQQKLAKLRTKVCLDPARMMHDSQTFSTQDVIDVISRSPSLRIAYKRPAGVGEGYTVGQHSLMVMDVFCKELQHLEHTQHVLTQAKITPATFTFFLALHDIGKGYTRNKGKKAELSKTRELIHKHAEQLALKQQLPLFDVLLSGDLVGDYLKKRDVTIEDCHSLINNLKEMSYHLNISSMALFELFVLFHQCDASSYPVVREKCFSNDPSQLTSLGHVRNLPALVGQGDAIYGQSNQEKMQLLRDTIAQVRTYNPDEWNASIALFDLDQPESINLAQIGQLITIRKAWQQHLKFCDIDRKQEPHYQDFRAKMLPILDHKLPTRLTRALKFGEKHRHSGQSTLSTFWMFMQHKYPEVYWSKQDRKTQRQMYRARLFNDIKSCPEAALQLLERVKVIHGSNSSTLAMMQITGDFTLRCTGDLISRNIAPMCGELATGVDPWGVNQHSISAMTVGGFSTCAKYATGYNFDPQNNMARFSNQSRLSYWFHRDRWVSSGVYLLQMRQWNPADFARIDHEKCLAALGEQRIKGFSTHEKTVWLIEHEFTQQEREYLNAVYADETASQDLEMPETLAPLFAHETDIHKFIKMLFRAGCMSWEHNFRYENFSAVLSSVFNFKMSKDDHAAVLGSIMAKTQKLLECLEQHYAFAFNALTCETVQHSVPLDDTHLRQMISQPVPIIFGSTTYIPKENGSEKEFEITEALPLGAGGFDLIFTDTEESRQHILRLLPEALREEVNVHLYSETFENVPFPLYHDVNMVRWSK